VEHVWIKKGIQNGNEGATELLASLDAHNVDQGGSSRGQL
jgi:hypothetical protein